MKTGNQKLITAIEKDERGRIFFWDNLKFLLIILVVMGHAIDYYTPTSVGMRKLWFFIYIFHMPLFVFISGYFSKNAINGKRFRVEKAFAYILLYFLLKMCFYILNRYIFGDAKYQFQFFTEGAMPWYLLTLGIWICIAYLIKNIKPVYVLTVSIAIGVLVGYDKTVGDFVCLARVLVFLPYFMLGYYLNKETIMKLLKNIKLKYFSILFLIATIGIILIYGENIYRFRGLLSARNPYLVIKEPLYGGIYRLLLYGVTIFVSLGIMYIMPKCKTIFTQFGSRTLQVYFLHDLIIMAYQHYKLNNYIINISSSYWLNIYLLLSIVLVFVLSLKIFEYPFKMVTNIKLEKIFI